MYNIKLWMFNESVDIISSNITESITKISNIGNHLYFLTANNRLYQGNIEKNEEDGKNVIKIELVDGLTLIDIDACKQSVFIVDADGNVFRCSENLDIINEISLVEEYTCSRGHNGTKNKKKVRNIAVGEYGQLYVTQEGELWGSGYMTQIGINSDFPKKAIFFDGRHVYSVNVGNDLAIVVVSKQSNNREDESDEEDVFVNNCPQCLSASQLTSPASQTSISDICPLGVKVQGSYDIETTSTSSKNDTSVSSSADTKEITSESKTNNKTEKNIIFRNTEAAKDFLTRQISRMSSAGEEYLVECTEKPTRIIKENMTNVASFVYEGVKTVGDKVVTLSRHVSGSSDCNSVIENLEEAQIRSKYSSREEIATMSQCTSEKDLYENEIQQRVESIVGTGMNLINCEVWTWGNIIHGQLGLGDIKRERPLIITKLSNIGVCKVSVQSFHASVLTVDGRAFIWGQNDHNQVTLENNLDQSSPKLYVTEKLERVKDVVCGMHYTSLLTNTELVHYFGKGAMKLLTLDCSTENTQNCDDERGRINFCENLLASAQFTLLNLTIYPRELTFLRNFIVQEQRMLEEMILVQQNIIKPLQKKNGSSQNGELLENLCKFYVDLMYCLAVNVHSLLEFSNNLVGVYDVLMLKCVDEYMSVYRNYIITVHNVISIDCFQNISKLIEVPQNLYKLRPDVKKDKNSDEHLITTYLISPLNRLQNYISIIKKFTTDHNSPDKRIKDLFNKWNEFVSEVELKRKDAESTKTFWLNSGKSVDSLKLYNRRLIRDSHQYPFHLLNASRFTSHWFVLFTDIFAHISGSTVHEYNLTTIWIEPHPQDEQTHQFQISLKMPEDVLVLFTTTPESKIEWFHALQQAIISALNKTDLLQPPSIRSCGYTFTKSGFFKDASYCGRWLNAKMHGLGKIEWPDGKVYTGQFSNNLISGYGLMEIPNIGTYEGQWRDNQQNGYGIFTYSNTDLYKGHFKDGLRHGHGFLRQGNFLANAASFYIGDWVAGVKCGYGVMDDIVTGEKYIGNWADNKKHGNGLIVTSDGVYYEGVFNQDVLTGQGVMILEDGTHYEGEFRGAGVLNGKGTLTLPSGHKIEGHLSGSWNSEGIKITNGTFLRANAVENNEETVSVDNNGKMLQQKWKALFKQCFQVLGIPENNKSNGIKPIETQKIWQNVAIYLSNASTMKTNKCEKNHNSINNLDIIPPFGREKMDLETCNEVKNYLLKAFESNFHPLGLLLNNLTEAYTTTYGGRAHHLLLTHAINELIFMCKRLYEIIEYLFPALPPYGEEYLIDNNNTEEVISCQSLLYPIVLPKVHHPLFTLFTLRNEQQEKQYKRTLIEWNKQLDHTLMSFLSVDQKFFKTELIQTSSKNQVFLEAIETLQQLKSTFTPLEKLLVIRQTVERMTPVAQQYLGSNYVWNMDDLFPVFLYVVVRARIPDLGSELDFIDHFIDSSLESGELGIMFTTLKACYQQILQEKVVNY